MDWDVVGSAVGEEALGVGNFLESLNCIGGREDWGNHQRGDLEKVGKGEWVRREERVAVFRALLVVA